MQKVNGKLHHTTTVDNHKSITNLGETHVDTCLRHLRFFEVLKAGVIQKPKTHISDAESYQKNCIIKSGGLPGYIISAGSG